MDLNGPALLILNDTLLNPEKGRVQFLTHRLGAGSEINTAFQHFQVMLFKQLVLRNLIQE